jgi:hypothetical protein
MVQTCSIHERGDKCTLYNILVGNDQGNYCMEDKWG